MKNKIPVILTALIIAISFYAIKTKQNIEPILTISEATDYLSAAIPILQENGLRVGALDQDTLELKIAMHGNNPLTRNYILALIEKRLKERNQKVTLVQLEKMLPRIKSKQLTITSNGRIGTEAQYLITEHCPNFHYIKSVQQTNECGTYALLNAYALQQVYDEQESITAQNIKQKFNNLIDNVQNTYNPAPAPLCFPKQTEAYEIVEVQKKLNEFIYVQETQLFPQLKNLYFFHVIGKNVSMLSPKKALPLEMLTQHIPQEHKQFKQALKEENGIIHCIVRYYADNALHFVLFSIIKSQDNPSQIIYMNSNNPILKKPTKYKPNNAFVFVNYICNRLE